MKKKALLILAVLVVIIAAGAAVYVLKGGRSSGQGSDTTEIAIADNTLQISTEILGDDVAFVDYDSKGTAMQIILYKDEKGEVHGAFNTCQVCNGSPYAYFVQEENNVVCQNCGNLFALQEIGAVRGGCNPIPLEFTQEGDTIKIDTSYLDQNASLFKNWKQGI